VKPDNPEVQAARQRLLPVVRRAEMLGELMRLKWSIAIAGTHGKTTTTSMVGALLEAAGRDPTIINGGIINAHGTNARLGAGDWMVVEADESDGTFVKLPATIAIITNIDPEHLDHYGTVEALHQGFEHFAGNIPFYGLDILCIDHPVVQGLIPRLSERRIVTYGFSPQADIRAVDIELGRDGARYNVLITDRRNQATRTITGLTLPMFGRHNVQNSLAVVAVARELRLGDDVLRAALAEFKGVKRRFTKVGEAHGITVIDDYAHHPVEIAAVLSAARDATAGNVIAVVQPHRYTTPTPSWSPMSIPPAKRRSKVPRATPSSRVCARAAIARSCRSPHPTRSPRPSRDWRSPAISLSAWAPARSPIGRRACQPSSKSARRPERVHDDCRDARASSHRPAAQGAGPAYS
jgi:UDP-N-acetylmuramate--alanine ligase